MKTNIVLTGLVGMLLLACSENIELQKEASSKRETVVKIEVEDEFASTLTRANYTGFPATTFETGDAIGVYAFDGSSYVASNIRYVKQSNNTWTADEDVPYAEGYTYYAYFPYRATTYTPSTSGDVNAIDTKFASFINDANNYFWQADQSTKAGYTYSNLMINKGTVAFTTADYASIRFTMKHKRALALFNGEDAIVMTFKGNIPYQVNTTKQFLMKPSTNTSFTDDNGTYSLNAGAGEYIECEMKIDYEKKYLTFEAIEDGTFSFTQTGLSYSLDDGETWTALAANTATPTVSAGNKILWKGELTASSSSGIGTFSSTSEYKCYGNTMSLIYGDDFREQTILKNNYQFNKLFYNSKLLTDIENLQLPATTLTSRCYIRMFYGCTGPKTSPELPATTLTVYCYQNMFNGCTSLTTAPTLPATTLTTSCYSYMFSGCTSLTTAPALPATTLTVKCYQNMFSECTSLTTAPALPATSLADNCYDSMFRRCTSLTTAPELPATILTDNCYRLMFSECTKLKEITCLATDISAYGCLISWLDNVSSTGTFTKDASMTSWPTGTGGIPSGWTVQDYTP